MRATWVGSGLSTAAPQSPPTVEHRKLDTEGACRTPCCVATLHLRLTPHQEGSHLAASNRQVSGLTLAADASRGSNPSGFWHPRCGLYSTFDARHQRSSSAWWKSAGKPRRHWL